VYQWKRGGVNLPGETNATLQLDGVLASDAGDYSVEVSNSAGTVTSDVATLTVLIPGPPSASSPTILSDGSFQFSASGDIGEIGESYRLWGSTNVTLGPVTSTWTLLTNGIFGPAPVLFKDAQAPGFAQRFYLITVP
jgi:hypothetical protein